MLMNFFHRKPATYRIPDENEIFAEEDKPRRGRRSAPDPPKKRKSNNHGKAKLKKTLTLLERKQQKEEKKLKAAEEKSRAKGNSPAPIRIKISLKGKNGKNGSGANSRAQSDNESVDSEGPHASKAESEISDPASDAEVCHRFACSISLLSNVCFSLCLPRPTLLLNTAITFKS